MNRTTTATTLDLHRGSAIEILAGLPDDHVDLVATDPPYGLTKRFDLAALLADWTSGADHDTGGRGLMGHRWDGVVPGPATWAQVLRVLKPGGYAFVFAAPRTVDLMGLALRLAGFEIVDQIVWIHGCLTDDAEILTESGWKKGVDVEVGEVVAQWDSDTGAITLAPIEEVIRAPYCGPMTVFRNHDTDQVLTPNHRVYHQSRVRKQVNGTRTASWSDYQVKEAGDINRWQPIRLPLGGIHDGPGIGGDDYAALLGWVWTEGGFDKTGTGVRIYQSPKANPDEVDKIDRLLGRLGIDAKRYYRERSYHHKVSGEKKDEVCWFFTGAYAESVRRDLPGKHPTFDLLWRMTASEKRAMWGAAMAGDGSGAQFHQKGADDLEWAQTLLSTIGQRGRIGMRKDRPGIGWVSVTPRPETEIVRRHLAATPDEQYEGDVWCVKVPTGAFVARRNGKVFITGNSGWPKSRDVGKQMAKKFGDDDPRSADWDGWGTSLKPANEPIIVARKPLAGTVVDNVLTFGTGALHIDAGRIGDTGRFPANVVLAHEPGCRPLGEVAVRTGSGTAPTRGVSGADQDGNTSATYGAETRPAGTVEVTHRNPDGTETVDAWDCAPGCAVAALDAQSGRLKARGNVNPTRSGGGNGRSPASAKAVIADHGAGDWGGASRFFYCAKPSQSERNAGLGDDQTNEHPSVKPVALMRYLIELAARPGAVVLDPYLGSGTTAVAAAEAGVNCVGIDRDDDGLYLPVAAARARHAGAAVQTYGWEPEAIAS